MFTHNMQFNMNLLAKIKQQNNNDMWTQRTTQIYAALTYV